jgi:nicotinamide-nucleotide amidase
MKVEIIAIGNEVLSGFTINSNAAFLSQELMHAGFLIDRHTVFPDDPIILEKGLAEALNRNDIVITTGGLGPTCDDLSRQTAAKLFDSDCRYDEEIAADLKKRYGSNLTSLTDQATVPAKAIVFKNSVGTAPGFLFKTHKSSLFMIPGVPAEMRAMFLEHVLPYLKKTIPYTSRYFVKHLYFFNTAESSIDPFLRQLKVEYPDVDYGIYPAQGYVSVNFSIQANSEDDANLKLNPPYQRIAKEFANFSFFSPSGKLEEAVQRQFIEKGLTLSSAESCTGGQFAATITQQSGSSQYFQGSIVAYSNQLKTKLLNVPEKLIREKGAVSEEVVRAMLSGLFEQTGSDYGVAVTGVAGPTGGSTEKPVGTLWCAAGKRGSAPHVWQPKSHGNRQTIVTRSVHALLAELLILTR